MVLADPIDLVEDVPLETDPQTGEAAITAFSMRELRPDSQPIFSNCCIEDLASDGARKPACVLANKKRMVCN